MPSTYTTNLGIEKIGTGEQSGTWGTTTNTNFDLIDQGVNGIVQVTLAAVGSTGSPNALTIDNGALSDGRNKFIEFVDGGDLGGTAYVQLQPNDSEKVAFIRNSLSGSRSIIIFQGTYNASNDFEIPNGADVVLKFDGAGASATVTQVFENLTVSSATLASGVTVNAILDEDNMASDSDTALATQQSIKAYVDSQVTAQDLDIAGDTGTGAVDLDSQSLTIAGTANEIETSASGQTITVGLPNAVTIADLTATTADINGGTIDGTVIGGSSAAAGTFTSITGTSANINGTVTADGLTVDGSASVKVNSGTNQLTIDNDDSTGTAASPQFTDIVFQGYLDRQRARIRGVDRASSYTRGGLTIQTQNSSLVLKDRMFVDGDGDISFYEDTGTTAKFFWDASAERLGIGTTSPSSALDVVGTVTADGLTVDGTLGNWSIDSSGTTQTFTRPSTNYIRASDASGSVLIQTGGNVNRALFAASGNVSFYEDTGTTPKFFWDASAESLGIGTTSPSVKLDTVETFDTVSNILSNGTYAAKFTGSSSGGVGRSQGIILSGSDSSLRGAAIVAECQTTGNDHDLIFATSAVGSAPTEHMRIDSSGNVGIGTSSPVAPLDVVAGADDRLLVTNSSGDTFLSSVNAANTAYNGLALNGSEVKLFTNASERMRINSSGNVGIGTSSPSGILHLAAGNPDLYITCANTGQSDILMGGTSDPDAGIIRYADNDDSMRIFTNNAEAMRIDSSGNLLVGGTGTPTSSAGNMVLYNGTAPTGNATDGVILYAEDVSSSSELKVRDEAGNVTTLSPHNFDLIPEGPSEDMAWSYYSERDGKRINVDMLKAIRVLEKLSGEKLVFEN